MPRLSDSESSESDINDEHIMQLFVSDDEANEFSGFSAVESVKDNVPKLPEKANKKEFSEVNTPAKTTKADSAKAKVSKKSNAPDTGSSKGPGKGPGKNRKGKAPIKRTVVIEDDTEPGPSSGKKAKKSPDRPANYEMLQSLLEKFMETYKDNRKNELSSNAPQEPEAEMQTAEKQNDSIDPSLFDIFGQINVENQANANQQPADNADEAAENPQIEDEEEFKFELPKIFDDDVVFGENAQANIAEMVNAITRKKANLESVIQDIKVPANCKTIVPPRINAEIWSFLKRHIKTIDLLMQNDQRLLGTAIVPVIKMAEMLSKTVVNVASLRDLVMKAMTILCSLFFEFSFSRKVILKPHLEPKYQILCNRSEEIGQNLFGDDVSKRIKEINETQKLQGSMKRKPYGGYSKNVTWPRGSGARGNMRGGSYQYQNQGFLDRNPRNPRGTFRGRGQRGRYPRRH